MKDKFGIQNLFWDDINTFNIMDPHLKSLSHLKYQLNTHWWSNVDVKTPGIYMLTGGRQVGKSTSCKQLIQHCLTKKYLKPSNVFYLPCDEIFDPNTLSNTIRDFLASVDNYFLLIIDEVTFVPNWDRVIKSLADEGQFQNGFCLLTGSDTVILKEAAMSFPGRRGNSDKTDFHFYPLSFKEYVDLVSKNKAQTLEQLEKHFAAYLNTGGYLRAINDYAIHGKILDATYQTYEQWIRGDFLKRGKSEQTLLNIFQALITVGVSQISYTKLASKIGLITNDTCIDYCNLLERMDILINLQAFDQNKNQGFPRKDRKFHFFDPFIFNTVYRWLQKENKLSESNFESNLVEATTAAHCTRFFNTFYFKGTGEIDIITLDKTALHAIEVKWANQVRPVDLKMLKHFKDSVILSKQPMSGSIESIDMQPVYEFLYHMA